MGVINGKAGKVAVLPKFSDMLTQSLPRGADYDHSLALPHLKFYLDYAPEIILGIIVFHTEAYECPSKLEFGKEAKHKK